MIKSLLLALTWHLSGTMMVFKPLGVKLCEERCVSYGQCNSPLYVEQQLECYLTETDTISTKLAIQLPAPKHDKGKSFYRKMSSSTRKPVTIKRKQNSSKSYTTVGVGKGSINIKFHNQGKNWSEARKVCQDEGGDLVKVDTKQKKVVLKTYMKSLEECVVWIGLTDMTRNNTYIWTDGSPLIFNDWIVLQPDHKQDEDCVVTGRFTCTRLYIRSWGWNDVRCFLVRKFICEKTIYNMFMLMSGWSCMATCYMLLYT